VESTKQKYLLRKLVECYYVTTSFDLWISRGAHDIFVLAINFLGVDWQPKHITIGLFEASETIGQVLARNLIALLDEYGLRKKIVAYVKNEGANFNEMTMTLKLVISCEILDLDESFQSTCFNHAFFKACRYGTSKDKVCKKLKCVSIKVA